MNVEGRFESKLELRCPRKLNWIRESIAAVDAYNVMAYAVDARIREQHRLATAGKEGTDGEDWLHSDAAQRQSLALPEFAHTREVISKFGGVIRTGTPVSIPNQFWNQSQLEQSRNPFSSDSFRSRSTPSHVIINSGIAGYKGFRPQAAQWSMPHRRADKRSAFLKPYIEGTGGNTEVYSANTPHVPDHARLNLPGGRAGLAKTNRESRPRLSSHIRNPRGLP